MKRIYVSPGAWVLLGLLLYLNPAHLALPFLAACICHEAAHGVMMTITDSRLLELHIRPFGAEMLGTFPSYRAEMLCLLAGPITNLLMMVLFWNNAPALARLSGGLGLYNLLPVPSLDGGRVMLLVLLHRFSLERGEKIVACLAWIVAGALTLCGTWCTFALRWGTAPLMLGASVLVRVAVNAR